MHGLKKDFPGHKALLGISFCVPQGSIYGFLGPNGAGKTTTIKVLLGLLAASRGSVRVLGEKVRFGKKAGYLNKVGYLPQDPVFPEGLTGRELLSMVASIYKMNRVAANRRSRELIEEFELADAAGRLVSAYSRGMKQRLGIAAVLLTAPELLILDEPVSALDPVGRRKVLELILALRGRATVFFSSHILADVEKVCDRITIIDKGAKLMENETKEILNRYTVEQYIIGVYPEYVEHAQNLLREHPAVRSSELHEEGLLITSEPGRADALPETILPGLIDAGIVVTQFMRRQVGLEEVFFKVLRQGGRNGGNS